MKSFIYHLVAVLFVFISQTSRAQYQVSTWYGNKTAAVTYTFDGYKSTSKQLSVAVPLFDTYGYKVTLTTITDWITDWSGLKAASLNGHEIASLTITHTSLADQTDSAQEYELSESQRIINEQIPNAYCLSLALPYCEVGNQDLVKKYYICGRICSGVIEPATPSDLYQISSIITGEEGSVLVADDLNTKVELAKDAGGWCVFLIHGIDGDGGYSSIASRQIKSHLSYMNDNDSVYWIGTFLDVVKYIRERDAVTISEQTITSDSVKVTITDGLVDSIYNHPLTIERTLPTGWASAKVYNEFKQITSTISVVGTDTCVVFDAIPDQDAISISKNGSLAGITQENDKGLNVFPNPFAGTFSIQYPGDFSYEVFSLNGTLVEAGNSKKATTLGQNLPIGSYLLKIKNNRESKTVKLVKTK